MLTSNGPFICRQCRRCSTLSFLKLKGVSAGILQGNMSRGYGGLYGTLSSTLSTPATVITTESDLFVGGAKFTFPRPVFWDQSGAYFEASSKFSMGIFNALWSFMCHRATYFEKFLICFFEAFSNWKGLQYG